MTALPCLWNYDPGGSRSGVPPGGLGRQQGAGVRRLRGWIVTPIGIVSMWLSLLGMVALGLNVSGAFGARHEEAPSALDYSAPPFGSFLPLRDRFVSQVLGAAPALAGTQRRGTAQDGFAYEPENVTHGLTNDAVAQAYDIRSVPFTARSDSNGATRESADPSACTGTGSTVWYRYRATGTGTLIATTVASYAATLGVFIAPASHAAHALGCDSDPGGLTRVGFAAFKGTTYLFQITAKPRGGTVEFALGTPHRATAVSVLGDGQYTGALYDFGYPKISSDGRFVVFEADPSRFDRRCAVRADGSYPCGQSQIFIRDLKLGTTELVSLTSSGGIPDQDSIEPWVSGDGRYVTFTTDAEGVTEDPDHGDPVTGAYEADVFRRDRLLGKTVRVTMGADGHELDGADGSISDDGRYVAFWGDWEHRRSAVHGPNYPIADVFLKDMLTGAVTLLSVTDDGTRGNHDSITPQISPDGTFVTFWSRATNLAPGSTAADDANDPAGPLFNGRVFVADVRHHHLSFECVAEGETSSHDHCVGLSISTGGRYSIFWSDATDLIKGAPSGGTVKHPIMNLYLRDRRTGHLELVNVTDNGTPVGDVGEQQSTLYGNDRLYRPWISSDGSVVAFDANAALAPGDRNGLVDAYVRDRANGRTIRVSETPSGGDPNGQSVYPYPTGDGSTVAFLSHATNLVPGSLTGWNMYVCRWRQ